ASQCFAQQTDRLFTAFTDGSFPRKEPVAGSTRITSSIENRIQLPAAQLAALPATITAGICIL
ncbi:MAG: hypothetical protein J6K80_00145, partial [Oscillospiraceae bacterium]|nr:hypothetical protein [Oscillospiraceae bacterium]